MLDNKITTTSPVGAVTCVIYLKSCSLRDFKTVSCQMQKYKKKKLKGNKRRRKSIMTATVLAEQWEVSLGMSVGINCVYISEEAYSNNATNVSKKGVGGGQRSSVSHFIL